MRGYNVYHIYSVISWDFLKKYREYVNLFVLFGYFKVFLFKNNHKNPDLSCKAGLDFEIACEGKSVRLITE